MKHFRILSGLMTVSAILASAACVQQQSEEQVQVAETADVSTKKVELRSPITTVKPGASVTFSHEHAGAVEAGENGSVTITVHEGYPAGTLKLEASGDEGLEVFGSGVTARMDMVDATTHSWRVDYNAAADGVYYINVMATAEPEGGLTDARAYAVRVEVGDWETAQSKLQGPATETLASGEQAVIMEAEETIED